MNPFKRPGRLLVGGILACAFALRVRYLMSGVPFAVEIDEPAIVDRALSILQSGSWNPRGFDYPSLVVYLQACVTAVRFMWGALQGQWSSLGTFDISAAYEAGRLVAAVIGTATVWLTYRLGKDLDSRTLGVIAAAQLAVYPMHVRESHFILTDVPTTVCVLLTVYLTVRAGRVRTVAAYAWAGCAAGLAAAAKYNGAVVVVVILLGWLLNERSSEDRWWKLLAALIVVPMTFLIVVPYAFLDLPGFLNGVGGQMARFAQRTNAVGADAPWRAYLAYLSLAWRWWVPTAALGAAIVLWRRRSLAQWAIPVGFVIAYFYVLATHGVVFGRYTLPLLPGLCLLAAVPIVELARWGREHLPLRSAAPVLLVLGTLMIAVPFASDSFTWLRDFHRPDTRLFAGRWVATSVPKGTRVITENSGPTNLAAAGVEVVDRPNRLEEPADAYVKQGIEYVIVAPYSAAALPWYDPLVNAGRVVFEMDPSDERWGPVIRIVKLTPREK